MTRRSLPALGVLLWASVAWASQAAHLSLKWSALGPHVMRKKIELVLPDGTRVQGKVRGIDASGLRLKIAKTSDKRAQPKGLRTIPRESVSVLRVTGYRKIGRLLFTSGAVATAGALAARGARGAEGSLVIVLPAVGAAGTVGVGLGAYYFGKAVDKRVTVIRVEPEN